MRGSIALERVYGDRLALAMPTRSAVDALGALYVEHTVPDAAAVVRALQAEGIQVRIMSGGLLPAVLKLAAHVGVAARDVSAVDIRFDANGDYAGYDEASLLARSGGKRTLLEIWRRERNGSVMFVGDGVTDLETRDVADVFVAYAGVVERPTVTAAADLVIRSRSLAPVLPLALGGQRPRHASAQALYDAGLEMLEDIYRTYLGDGNAAKYGNEKSSS